MIFNRGGGLRPANATNNQATNTDTSSSSSSSSSSTSSTNSSGPTTTINTATNSTTINAVPGLGGQGVTFNIPFPVGLPPNATRSGYTAPASGGSSQTTTNASSSGIPSGSIPFTVPSGAQVDIVLNMGPGSQNSIHRSAIRLPTTISTSGPNPASTTSTGTDHTWTQSFVMGPNQFPGLNNLFGIPPQASSTNSTPSNAIPSFTQNNANSGTSDPNNTAASNRPNSRRRPREEDYIEEDDLD